MPTYEYRCPDGHEFELFQKMSEAPQASCPECGREAQRLLSAGAGLLFKGSGFYITDYRSDSYRKEARSESGDGSGKAKGSGKEGGGKEGGETGKAEPATKPKSSSGEAGSSGGSASATSSSD